MTENAAPLHIDNLTKRYDKNASPALNGASFTVAQGEIFGLIGLNGAGKTTLIKIILDLLDPDTGAAAFFGVPAKRKEARRAISYLPEKFQPGHLLKGKEFLALQLSFYGKPYNKDKAEEYCRALDLPPEALNKRITAYSKGMGQKLGLISAFLSEAPLLILDEPMSGLDPKARKMLKDALLNYRASGKTVFFSSHILADVAEICDNVAIVHRGKIVDNAPPADIIDRLCPDGTLEDAFLRAIAAGEENVFNAADAA